ncbi:MAG: hypothetical protein FJY97_06380 [candidate division Zixibacteria bacterium]|nr:hypothetical protein [candidate division Zixibacteria bacterium]
MTWPVLSYYDIQHLSRIALPLGGIGTGTVSLGGRGDLRDWEIVNRPAKGFTPKGPFARAPFFSLYARPVGDTAVCRILEGPLELHEYEGAHGSEAANHGMPRFRNCSFATAYPFGQVILSDPDLPVEARLEAFNPLIPVDAERSGIPAAILRYIVTNRQNQPIDVSVCGTLCNFIGSDGTETASKENENRYRAGTGVQGIYLSSRGVDRKSPAWGTMALTTTASNGVSFRTAWKNAGWGTSVLDFWDDLRGDGRIDERESGGVDMPNASLCVSLTLPPLDAASVTFLLTWHFPNRYTWSPAPKDADCCEDGNCDTGDLIGNYYTTRYEDAFDVAERIAPQLGTLEADTLEFVESFCASTLPEAVKEAALFNLSTLRSQTCFRTPDGRFYGWEGCSNLEGCCRGSCTHVWNYEQSTAFLFGDLSKTMREVEFAHATDKQGMMCFRVSLPLSRAQDFKHAAADGQMGCIMKMYRDWQLSGDDDLLRALYPQVRKTLEFCWIPGGWDADCDGVMEGCQHNTMDVEYYGPNPQMGFWYLGALRAMAEMANHTGDSDFAMRCRALYEQGRGWIDAHLFNGEYYEHEIRPPASEEDIAPSLRLGAGARDVSRPDYQLGPGCLVDQLVGQFMAHVCDLGYLADTHHVRTTLSSILKYNRRRGMEGHFNVLRSYVLGDESALLMASYPKGHPENPFPYFTEVMTGFEYTAAIGMLYEGMTEEGLQCIRDIRARYDGRKRSPFDEAECGHHYARAMTAWAAHLALSGFHYSAVTGVMTFTTKPGRYFWSTGHGWGTCEIGAKGKGPRVDLLVRYGRVGLSAVRLRPDRILRLDAPRTLDAGEQVVVST